MITISASREPAVKIINGETPTITISDGRGSGASFTQDAQKVTYKNENYPGYTNVESAITGILEQINYVAPKITSFTVDSDTLIYEIGYALTEFTFTWTLNKDVTSITFDGDTLSNSARSITVLELSENKTFTLSVSDGKNTATASKTFKFLPAIYYGGAVPPDEYTDDFLLSLGKEKLSTSRDGDYILTVEENEYGYICIPSRYGTPNVSIGGFSTDLEKITEIKYTNPYNHTEDYVIYRTSQTGLGTIKMTVT